MLRLRGRLVAAVVALLMTCAGASGYEITFKRLKDTKAGIGIGNFAYGGEGGFVGAVGGLDIVVKVYAGSTHDETDNMEVHYTLDGTLPTGQSRLLSTHEIIHIDAPELEKSVCLNVLAINSRGEEFHRSATYVFSDGPRPEGSYRLVKTGDKLYDGDRIVLCASVPDAAQASGVRTMAARQFSQYGSAISVDVDAVDGVIGSLPEGCAVFTVRSMHDGMWVLECGDKYMACEYPYLKPQDGFDFPLHSFCHVSASENDKWDIRYTDYKQHTVTYRLKLMPGTKAEYSYWQLIEDELDDPEYKLPEIYRFSPAPGQEEVIAKARDMYLAVEANELAEGAPAESLRFSASGGGDYLLQLSGIQGRFIIHDGRADLAGIYYGAGRIMPGGHAADAGNADVTGDLLLGHSSTTYSLEKCPMPVRYFTTNYDPAAGMTGYIAQAFAKLHIANAPDDISTLTIEDPVLTGVADTIISADDSGTDAAYYTIDGRRLAAKPSAPGVYIRQTPHSTHKLIIR